MNKILVTGGCGFIGSNFIRHLIKKDNSIHIINLDKLTYAGNIKSLDSIPDSSHQLIKGDICDSKLIESIFDKNKIDAVVHFAAESHVDRSIDGPSDFINTNIVGTMNLLEKSRYYIKNSDNKSFRFLHVSTDEVYGSLGESGKFVEETPYDPSSPYSASKASSDHLVRAWNRTFDFPSLITNCSNNYGPYQFPEKLIPLILINCLKNKSLPVYGKGENIRDWLFVEDHCEAIYKVLTRGKIGETYNIGGNNEIKNIEVVEIIGSLMDKLQPRKDGNSYSKLISFVTDRPGHDLRYAIDSTKIEKELGWVAQESFETGIKKTVEWYLSNENWWKSILENTYNQERLGVVKS